MIHLHRADRADLLLEDLRGLLAEPLSDPFAPETVCVHTRGAERWVAQGLSSVLGAGDRGSDGICANVSFPSPAGLAREVLSTVAHGAGPDPWDPARLAWPLAEVLDSHRTDAWLAPYAVNLLGPEHGERSGRLTASRRLAALFDRYALLRPRMLIAWRDGEDADGEGGALPEDRRWQAELWRCLRERVGEASPAESLEQACDRLREHPDTVELADRISLFGLTRLPAAHLQVFEALAGHRDVHVFALHPSAALWSKLALLGEGGAPRPRRRGDDPTSSQVNNPLLRSWGRDSREMQLVLGAAGPLKDLGPHETRPADTLLGAIQRGVREDIAPPGPAIPGQQDRRPVFTSADESLQVHACHGRTRQVEVLRDAVLGTLAADPTLEPRDVIVMCPDIETFAPLIRATFGASGPAAEGDDDGTAPERPDLRLRLADRALRQSNPLLGIVALLFELGPGRFAVSEVLDLADREPVRRRFGLDDDDLSRIEEWAVSSGVRWGLDAERRAAFKLDDLDAGTWQAGLRRILVGVTMSEDDRPLVGGVLPLDDVESGSIELAGRIAELVDRLRSVVDSLTARQPIDDWLGSIGAAVDLLTEVAPWEAWQREELDRLLEEVRDEAGGPQRPSEIALTPAEVRSLFEVRLEGRATRANFRTGHLTVCTLLPMRSIPHRVVCILGLDDGVFPRHGVPDGDDLTLDEPRLGERDPRAEDRQLLLDALMAAQDRLIITYTGNDERTNIRRPPAVPLGELLDTVERTVRSQSGRARDLVHIRHPLQPFDPRNFTAGALRVQGIWGFDPVGLAGARALSGPRHAPRPFLTEPLPAVTADLVELDDLVGFVGHPVRSFLRRRLGVGVSRPADDPVDRLPTRLDGLERWRVGQRLLDARLAGIGAARAREAELARGELPPGELGRPLLAELSTTAERIFTEVRALPSAEAEPVSVDVRVELTGGRLLVGTVAGVTGDVIRVATFSRVGARHRLGAWVRLLALSAAFPERRFEAAVVGRARQGTRDREVTISGLPILGADASERDATARRLLEGLVELLDRGMREPLPLACRTSAAYAEAIARGGDADAAAKAARSAWESTWKFANEDRDEEHRLVWNGVLDFDELIAEPPRDDESGPGWEASEATRFGRYSVGLWHELLDHEQVEDRMSRITTAAEFDVCAALPRGVTILEASAGTGKTYAMSALATRYVAEGLALRHLLLVTFTRMATGELRERVRGHLTLAERGLARRLAGVRCADPDPVVNLLSRGGEGEIAERHARLQDALADFDSATIATTHGFCQAALSELGALGDLSPETVFVEHVDDLLEEVVDDLYVRRFHGRDDEPPFDRDEALGIAKMVVANPTAPIGPSSAPHESVAAMRYRLAVAVRRELEHRKRGASLISFDDLLTRLSDVLSADGGARTVARLRSRYRVVLIDEFQDTDPVQWEIVRRAFAHPDGTLILVADPKQAIYAFRGADVYAYLEAAKTAETWATLRINRRSDQRLIDAYDALFADARLGEEGIVYRSVRAPAAHAGTRLRDAPVAEPLRFRVVDRDSSTVGTTPRGYARKAPAQEHVAVDLAADLARLLSSEARIECRDTDGVVTGEDPLRPGDVGVLVRTHRTAAMVREALEAVAIPAVINGAGSVFATEAAREWMRLLEAIERPGSATRAHAVALTCFFGWDAVTVVGADPTRWEAVHRRLHEWGQILRRYGVASMIEKVNATEALPARVLALTDGERRLTDIRHIGQLLHVAATDEDLGVAALVAWMARRIDEADSDTSDEERSRRLESDAQAVQILTIHRSKGLEFPIVYCPFLWEAPYIPDKGPVCFHDPDADGLRTVDVGTDGSDLRRHRARYTAEQRGEDLRLAYVAMTRARHQAVLWWAGTWESRHSALGRLLFARAPDGTIPTGGASTPDDGDAIAALRELATRADGAISVEDATVIASQFSDGAEAAATTLSRNRLERPIDHTWRRNSYSAITAASYEATVTSEPEDPGTEDEPTGPQAPAAVPDSLARLRDRPSPLASSPVGLAFGTLIHRVFEGTDFAATDLAVELDLRIAEVSDASNRDLGDPVLLRDGLAGAIETPLGGSLDGVALRELGPTHRLDELEFELPLVGGGSPSGELRLEAIAGLIEDLLAPDDPTRPYARRLHDPLLRDRLRGFLTGSIDLVLRAPGDAGRNRYALVDYKTNRLAGAEEELTLWHYRPEALAAEMRSSHYLLQASLYLVALHRYLRWRVVDYVAERDLAGVFYLFVRGMDGPASVLDATHTCGVFSWRPPGRFVEALSDLFDEGR